MNGINNIVFFNSWHNGDCFVGKEYIKKLIGNLKQIGDFNFYCLHYQSEKILKDLEAKHIRVNLPEEVDTLDIVKVVGDTMYINTWIGVFSPLFTKTQQHCNYSILSISWPIIFYLVEQKLGLKFQLINRQDRTDPADGIPTTDWTKYDIAPVKNFVFDKKKIVLICNNEGNSFQNHFSKIGNLENTIAQLASKHPETTFVCTQRVNVSYSNVFYTSDIFSGVAGGDLNEIAYLSTFCSLIVGKNTGPYTFCQVKDNAFREDCIFYSISDRHSDTLLYNIDNIKCSHYFFNGKEEKNIIFTLDAIISGVEYLKFFKQTLITDQEIIQYHPPKDNKNFGDVELNWA